MHNILLYITLYALNTVVQIQNYRLQNTTTTVYKMYEALYCISSTVLIHRVTENSKFTILIYTLF